MSYESIEWDGGSGAKYLFHILDLEADVPARPGLFIYCKKNHDDLWVPVYIGHGDVAAGVTDAALRDRIEMKGATSRHLRLNTDPDDRAAEVADLLAFYKNAFEPEGCHVPDRELAPGGSTARTGAEPRVSEADQPSLASVAGSGLAS